MAIRSSALKSELIAEINKLGGKSTEGTTASGKVYRVWMDFKAAITGKDRKAILSSCEFGEDAAQDTYEKVLKSDDLDSNLASLVSRQKEKLDEDHQHVKHLRDSVLHDHDQHHL